MYFLKQKKGSGKKGAGKQEAGWSYGDQRVPASKSRLDYREQRVLGRREILSVDDERVC
jgi:hypothetical protein